MRPLDRSLKRTATCRFRNACEECAAASACSTRPAGVRTASAAVAGVIWLPASRRCRRYPVARCVTRVSTGCRVGAKTVGRSFKGEYEQRTAFARAVDAVDHDLPANPNGIVTGLQAAVDFGSQGELWQCRAEPRAVAVDDSRDERGVLVYRQACLAPLRSNSEALNGFDPLVDIGRDVVQHPARRRRCRRCPAWTTPSAARRPTIDRLIAGCRRRHPESS